MVNHTEKQYTVKWDQVESDTTNRGWYITYGTRQIVDSQIYFLGEKTIYFTLAEHYMQFTDLLEESGYHYIGQSEPSESKPQWLT